MKKTKLLTTLGAVALIGAIGVGSTFAYLTAETTAVTNTFTVGNVNFDEKLNGGLSESAVERGKSGLYEDADEEGVWSVKTNNYTKLTAGEVVYKDPTAHMAADSEDAYLFMRVYNTEATKTVNGKAVRYFDNIDIDTAKWEEVGRADNYIDYVYKDAAVANGHYTLFNHVTMGNIDEDDVTRDEAGNVTGTTIPQIIIKACAVQHKGLSQEDAYAQAKFAK